MKAKEIKWQRKTTLWSMGTFHLNKHCWYKKEVKKGKVYYIPDNNAQAKFIFDNFNPKQEIALNYEGVSILEHFLNEHMLHGDYSYNGHKDIVTLKNKDVYMEAIQRMIKNIKRHKWELKILHTTEENDTFELSLTGSSKKELWKSWEKHKLGPNKFISLKKLY